MTVDANVERNIHVVPVAEEERNCSVCGARTTSSSLSCPPNSW